MSVDELNETVQALQEEKVSMETQVQSICFLFHFFCKNVRYVQISKLELVVKNLKAKVNCLEAEKEANQEEVFKNRAI